MALDPVTNIRGTGVYLPGDDIDTDRIIPARFLKCVTFDGLGEHLFRDARFAEDGSLKAHPLNDARFEGATVMIANSNFGCGSSREHAPQAIYRAGFRALIAESFAEIFFGNAVTLGMPCLEASHAVITELAGLIEADPATVLEIDIEGARVSAAGRTFGMSIRPSARDALLAGRWDPIGELLEAGEAISRTADALPYVRA
ncbi:MAG TPA: 3-isopropylmalate dehydratase small subunit [Trueperaceae bacterium]